MTKTRIKAADRRELDDRIIQAVHEWTRDWPPAVEDIRAATRTKSKSTIHLHLAALEQQGMIEYYGGPRRFFRLTAWGVSRATAIKGGAHG